jgi:ubiquitin C-terminal hydrolase
MCAPVWRDSNRIRGKLKWEELKDIDGETDKAKQERYWKNHKQRNDSPITDIFTGQLMSELVCQKCQHRSLNFDPFEDISVELKRLSRGVYAKAPSLAPLAACRGADR